MPATASALPPVEVPPLNRVQKLAALLVMLGPEPAAQILRGLEPLEVEAISNEMARFSIISQELQAEILREFAEVALDAGTAVRGGVDVARATLEKAMGEFKANEVLARVAPTRSAIASVQEIAEMDSRQIYNLIRHEQPQAVALVLSYAGPGKAAETLTFFSAEQRDKILERIATLAPTPVEVVEKVVQVLLAKRGANRTLALSQTGGVKTVADLLNAMERSQGKTLLGSIEERNPELGQAIRQKMFTFEDLARLDPPMLQRILREVDLRELALALKNAGERTKTTLLACVTRRAAETVREEINLLGPVRFREIEVAQSHVIETVRRLEAEGAIELGPASEEGQYEMV